MEHQEEQIDLGSTVWEFDDTIRQYTERRNMFSGDIIFRAKFRERIVVGETPRSWIVGYYMGSGDNRQLREVGKMPKSGKVSKERVRAVFYTKQAMEDAIFINDHRHKLAEFVRRVDDADVLRKVADLVGYVPGPEKA
jgi:hypothetical protein